MNNKTSKQIMVDAAKKYLSEHGEFPPYLLFGLRDHEFAVNFFDQQSVLVSREELEMLVKK